MTNIQQNQLRSRIAGAVYGQAIGDALGMPSELWARERVKAFFGTITDFLDGPEENNAACYFKAGEFTDDTAQALAVVDAVIEREGKIDPALIGKHILAWAERIDAFNKNILGPTSKNALNAIKVGTPIAELPNNGMTNGAAMRVAPVACMLSSASEDAFIEDLYQLSSPTHKSDVAIAGAVAIAYATTRAVAGDSWQQILQVLPVITEKAQKRDITTFSPSMAKRIELGLELVEKHRSDKEAASEAIYHIVGAGTSMIESVPAAIAMVELAETDAMQCAFLCANLGGDTDTIGAMATAICGALNGVESLDEKAMETIKTANSLNLEPYIDQLMTFRQQREVSC